MKMKKFILTILAVAVLFAGPGSALGEWGMILPGCDSSYIMGLNGQEVELAIEAGADSRTIYVAFHNYVTRVTVFEGEVYVRSYDENGPKESGQIILRNGQRAEFMGGARENSKYKKLYLPRSYATTVTVFEGEVYVRSYDENGPKENGQVILKNGQKSEFVGTLS